MSNLLEIRDQENPLEARVAVNHYFQNQFGIDRKDLRSNYRSIAKHVGLSGDPLKDYATLRDGEGDRISSISEKGRSLARENHGFFEQLGNSAMKGLLVDGVGAMAESYNRGIANNPEGAAMLLAPTPSTYGAPSPAVQDLAEAFTEGKEQFLDAADEVQAWRRSMDEKFFTYSDFDQSTVGQVARGMGQAVPMISVGFGASLITRNPLAIAAATMPMSAAMSLGQMYDQGYYDYKQTVEAAGKPFDMAEANRAGMLNLPGASIDIITDTFLAGRIFRAIPGQRIRNLSKDAGKSFVFGGLSEMGQEFYSNVSAKYLAGYDPDRVMSRDLVNAFIIGSLVDAGVFTSGKTINSVMEKFVFRDGAGSLNHLKAMNKTIGTDRVRLAFAQQFGDLDIADAAARASEGDKKAYKELGGLIEERSSELGGLIEEQDRAALMGVDLDNMSQEQKRQYRERLMEEAIQVATDDLNATLPEGSKIELKLDRTRTLQQQVDEMVAKGELTSENAQDYIRDQIKAAQLEGVDPDDINADDIIIRGKSLEFVGKDGFVNDVAVVYKGADITTVFEEVSESYIKRQVRNGKISREQLRAWKDQYEKENGKEYGDSDTDLVEWFSTLAVSRAISNKGLNKGLQATIQRFLEYFQSVFKTANTLRQMERNGLIDQEFLSALDESVGVKDLSEDTEVDTDTEGVDLDVDDTFQISVAVAPTRSDNLKSLKKSELDKRTRSAQFHHLVTVAREIGAAFGVDVVGHAQIGSWTEDGEVSNEVPGVFTFDTDDMELAELMANLLAMSAPDLQNSAMIIKENENGEAVVYSFTAKNDAEADRIARDLQTAVYDTDEDGNPLYKDGQRILLTQGFSYDPNSRIFSIAFAQPGKQVERILNEYISEKTKQGSLKAQTGLEGSRGDVSFPEEGGFRAALERSKKHFPSEQRTVAQDNAIRRAESNLVAYEKAKIVSRKAQAELDKIPDSKIPDRSSASILKSRPSFSVIPELAKFLDNSFQKKHRVRMYPTYDALEKATTRLNKARRSKASKESIEALESEIKALKGKIRRGISNAADALFYDVVEALSKNGSGMGWYSNVIDETMKELTSLYPELGDPGQMAVFLGILASTSQGEVVVNNFKNAQRIYKDYRERGQIGVYDLGPASDKINENLQLIQEVIDKEGTNGFMEFMDAEWTGGQLMDYFGVSNKLGGIGIRQTDLGAMALGPKIGAFFRNLNKDFEAITMDLWYTRTMHRYIGETQLDIKSEKVQAQLKEFRDAYTEALSKGGRTYDQGDIKGKSDEEVLQMAMSVYNRWSSGKFYGVSGFNKFLENGQENIPVEGAARKLKTSAGMKGAPQNKAVKKTFVEIVEKAQEKLSKAGFDLSNADVQAILWYTEKRLFAETGVANSSAAPANFLNAVMESKFQEEAAQGLEIKGDGTFQLGKRDPVTSEDPDLSAEEKLFDSDRRKRTPKEDELLKNIRSLEAQLKKIALDLRVDPGSPLPAKLRAAIKDPVAKRNAYNNIMKQLSTAQKQLRDSRKEGEGIRQKARAAKAKRLQEIRSMAKLEKIVQKKFAQIKQLMADRESTVEAIQELEAMVQKLPLPIRGKFTGFKNLANMKTEAGRTRYIQTAEIRLQKIFDRYLYSQRRNKLKNELKEYKNRRSSKMRKLSQKFGDKRNHILYAYDLAFNQDLLNTPRPPDGMSEEDALTLQEMFDGVLLIGANSQRVADAYAYLEAVQKEGRAEIDQFNQRRKARNEAMIEMAKEVILKGEKLDSKNRAKLKVFNKGLKDSVLARIFKGINLGQYGLEQLIESMDELSPGYAGYLNKTLFEPFLAAYQNEETMNREDMNMLVEGVSSIYPGMKFKELQAMIESWRQPEENTGIFYDEGTGVEEQPMSIMSAISFYMALKDPSLKQTFDNMKVTDDTIAALEQFIGEEGKAFGDFLMEAYEQKGIEIQATHRVTEGYNMDLVENYGGRLYRIGAVDESLDTEQTTLLDMTDPRGRVSVKNGSLKARQGSTLALEFRDADTEFMAHLTAMNHYISHGQVAKDLKRVFTDPEVVRAIKQKHGDQFYKTLSTVIDRIITGGERAAELQDVLGKVRSNISVATLGLNMPSFLKQLTSIPAFVDSIPAKAYAKYQAQFFKDPIKNFQLILNTEYIQNRLTTSYNRDVAEQIRRAKRKILSGGFKSFQDKVMFLTRMGDVGAIAIGGYAVYQYHYDNAINSGKSEAQAKKIAEKEFTKASERTQQSSAVGQLASFQSSNNVLLKLFTMFMTTPIQYQRTITLAATKALQSKSIKSMQSKKAVKTFAVFHILLPQIFQAMSGAFLGFWDDDDEKREEFWKSQRRALLLGNLNSYFILGDMLSVVASAMTGSRQFDILQSATFSKLERFSKEVADLFEEDKDIIEQVIDVAVTGSELVGLPVRPVVRQAQGVKAAVTGETTPKEGVAKFFGFSDYALGRESMSTTEQIYDLFGLTPPSKVSKPKATAPSGLNLDTGVNIGLDLDVGL